MSITPCPHPNHDDGKRTLFCECGKVKDQSSLKKVRLMGFTGGQSTSAAMDMFWRTGDPAVFSKPGDPDYDPKVSVA